MLGCHYPQSFCGPAGVKRSKMRLTFKSLKASPPPHANPPEIDEMQISALLMMMMRPPSRFEASSLVKPQSAKHKMETRNTQKLRISDRGLQPRNSPMWRRIAWDSQPLQLKSFWCFFSSSFLLS